MNKKFSTLLVGALLTGSVFSVSAQEDSPLMPRSAAFLGQTVKSLEAGKGLNAYESNGYYQLATDAAANNVLAMTWVAGKYQLTIEDVSTGEIPLDNTLWQISATWDKTSGSVNYVFVNKATLLPLQVDVPEDVTTPKPAIVEGRVTNWVWCQNVQDLDSKEVTAAVDTEYRVALTENSGAIEVTKYKANAAIPTGAIKLEAYEAGRVVLTAAQINSKLNNAKAKDEALDIVFTPDVVNPDKDEAHNIITETAWVARGTQFEFTSATVHSLKAIDETFYVPDFTTLTSIDKNISLTVGGLYDANSNANGGYVQLVSYKDIKGGVEKPYQRVLMVDTAYYDGAMNEKYDLKLALKELKKVEETYDASGALASGSAYATFQDQTLFRFVYEPTFDRVLVQAKQATYVEKKNLLGNADHSEGYDATTHPNGYIPFAYAKTASASAHDGFVADKAIKLDGENDGTTGKEVIEDNMIKLVYLTPNHSEITVNVPDANDMLAGTKGHGGALTAITLKGTKGLLGEWTFANIETDYYYIQNAKNESTALIPAGAWAYQDLTATSADEDRVDGNVVYSAEQFKTMPSAQWYIKGEGGSYTIYNRESGKDWSTQYWYAVKDANGNDVPNVYTNYGTFGDYGIGDPRRDTIRLVKVSDDVVKAKLNGYLNISQDVAKADTSVFTFKYVTPLEGVNLGMIMKSDSSLVMANGEAMNFKLERVTKDNAKYGLEDQKNMGNKLERVAYYIYADEVSSNSSEETGYHERKYVILEGGQYRLANFIVKDNQDGTTSIQGTLPSYTRSKFFVKEIGEAAKNYVLVDTEARYVPSTSQGTAANGVRMAMDQVSLSLRANGLPSIAENVYTNSLLNIVSVGLGNYNPNLAYGDTVKIFSNEYPEVVMYENGGMLAMSSLEVGRGYNTALFVDTAYVRYNTARPQYMFVLRPEFDPNCNFPTHEHHAVEGDYLVHMQDSVAQDVNKYTWDNKKFARLGFVAARHEGDTLLVKNSKFKGNNNLLYTTTNKDYMATTVASQDTINLADNSKDQYCTFALRYVDTNRDAFYLETLYRKGMPGDKYTNGIPDTKGWVRWHNGVPVVVSDLAQAGKFNFASSTDAPTANEGISADEVSIVAAAGQVIIKNAAGKTVTISNILGKTLANTVLSSDNVTISVPAGIVVVSVEGAEAVKAVVK